MSDELEPARRTGGWGRLSRVLGGVGSERLRRDGAALTGYEYDDLADEMAHFGPAKGPYPACRRS